LSGAAHLFTIGPHEPLLGIKRIGGQVHIDWPWPAIGFLLEETTAFAATPAATSWTQAAIPYQTNATHISVTISAPATNTFYRLRR
jgi:hypothetical protein